MPKNNLNNRSYSKEEKESTIAKLVSPNNRPVPEVSQETGIPKSTLSSWKYKELNKRGLVTKNKNISSNKKLQIVMETYSLNELELGKYCRENGLFVEEVKVWNKELQKAFSGENVDISSVKEELIEEKRKNKNLGKELRRKEKALAEAAALLVLQKKFQAFMEEEDD